MKYERFETQAEIYQALLDSKKIKRETWGIKAYIHLVGGALRNELGIDVSETRLNPPHEFLIYEEHGRCKRIS